MGEIQKIVDTYEDSRRDAAHRVKEANDILNANPDMDPEEKGIFKRIHQAYWRRAIILNALHALNPVLMSDQMNKLISRGQEHDGRWCWGQAFINLHESDLQICNCNSIKTCKSCRECVDFVVRNRGYERVKEVLKERILPIGWMDRPDYAPVVQHLANETGKCPKCQSQTKFIEEETEKGKQMSRVCVECGNLVEKCTCELKGLYMPERET